MILGMMDMDNSMRTERLPVVLPLYSSSLSSILVQLEGSLRDLAEAVRTGDPGYQA